MVRIFALLCSCSSSWAGGALAVPRSLEQERVVVSGAPAGRAAVVGGALRAVVYYRAAVVHSQWARGGARPRWCGVGGSLCAAPPAACWLACWLLLVPVLAAARPL